MIYLRISLYVLLIIFFINSVNLLKLSEIVDLPTGTIRGEILTTTKGVDYYAFKGIPYAAPPVGDLRFEAPAVVEDWDGILNATSDDKICYQLTWVISNNLNVDAIEQTEDCLYLSVYIPIVNETDPLPVMFWIYGGAFSIGSYSSLAFGPEYFMDHGVIIVTHNYRLGSFGFLSTGNMILPGNAGLKDQLFALKWVNKNINLFGGDPGKVTIFGQSAGAASISFHLNNPRSEGLFRAAILESGSTLNPWSYVKEPKHNAYKTAAYLDPTIDEVNTSDDELVSFLKSVSADQLLNASQLLLNEQDAAHVPNIQGLYYAPVIELEHPEAIVTESMYQTISSGGSLQVPIIIGVNSEEAIYQATNMDTIGKILKAWDEDVSIIVPSSMNIPFLLEQFYLGSLTKFFYCGLSSFENCVAGGVRYFSDQSIMRGVIKLAVLQAPFSEVYFYKFSYDGPLGLSDFVLDGAESVGHSEELYYIWQVPGIDLNYFPESDILTHDRLLTMWTNFAKYLNPIYQDEEEILQNITWPTFENGAYLDIDKNLTIEHHPRYETFAFWTILFQFFGIPPFFTW